MVKLTFGTDGTALRHHRGIHRPRLAVPETAFD
jgi:hypothetical protein